MGSLYFPASAFLRWDALQVWLSPVFNGLPRTVGSRLIFLGFLALMATSALLTWGAWLGRLSPTINGFPGIDGFRLTLLGFLSFLAFAY